MRPELRAAIAELLRSRGGSGRIRATTRVRGGCIDEAFAVDPEDGPRLFVKAAGRPRPGAFRAEADGLGALAAVDAIRVPVPIGWSDGEPTFLALTWIEEGPRPADFPARLGRELARLHQQSISTTFGFSRDNYIGATPQPNPWTDDWVTFWATARLGHQLDLAQRRGLLDATLIRRGRRLLDRLEDLIGSPDEPPVLLHGDLWSGNVLCDEEGAPVLVDPATSYGRREAELALTRLFGGFDHRFYEAYEEVWPLAPGAEHRFPVYELYHLLNHLNLFGRSYLGSCRTILERYG